MKIHVSYLKLVSFKVLLACLCSFAACFFLSAGDCQAAQTEGYRQIFDSGYVDWLKGQVVAQGRANINNIETESSLSSIAEREALMKARGNLLHILKKVRIDSNVLVRDIMQQKNEAVKAVRNLVHNSPILDKNLRQNATAVTVGLSLRGRLSEVLIPKGAWYEKIAYEAGPDLENQGRSLDEDSAQNASGIERASDLTRSKLTRLTGLIVDARGVDTAPSLLCRLFNEKGQKIYDPQMVKQERAYALGMAGYTQDMNTALQSKRVGNNPLVVRAVGTLDVKASQLIISDEEVRLIRHMKKNKDHLQMCKVIIVLGPSDESELVEFPLY